MPSLRSMLPDKFVLAMIVAVIAAIIAPDIGRADGPLKLGVVSKAGISLVFFLHGANLSLSALVSGLAAWRLHLLVQAATFVLFPILGFAIFAAGNAIALPAPLLLGFFYLCALPSTVSSSVAMTALAKGNVPAAIFNATISGLIGLIVTPILVSLVAGNIEGEVKSPLEAILDISALLLAPFVLGQLVRPLILSLLTRFKPWIGQLDRCVIVLIVYVAFCDSTAQGTWSQFSVATFALTIAVVAVILGIALVVTGKAARMLGFDLADEAAAVFCGSKKSLANGAPMAQVLFAGSPAIGAIMLPILLYHQLQLVVCAIMARKYADRIEDIAPQHEAG